MIIQRKFKRSFKAILELHFFNIVSQTLKANGRALRKSLAKSKTDVGKANSSVVLEEKKVKFAEKLTGEAPSESEEEEVVSDDENVDDEKKSKSSQIKALKRKPKLKAIIKSRLKNRIRERERKGESKMSIEEVNEEESEKGNDNDDKKEDLNASQVPISPNTKLGLKQKNYTLIHKDDGNLFLEVNGLHLDLGAQPLLNLNSLRNNFNNPFENVQMEMVANFSIYFPHNNISKILTDLKNQRDAKKEAARLERLEMRIKRARNEMNEEKKGEKKGFLASTRKSIFLWSKSPRQSQIYSNSRLDDDSIISKNSPVVPKS